MAFKTIHQIAKETKISESQIRLFLDRNNVDRILRENGRCRVCNYYIIDDEVKNKLIDWLQSKIAKTIEQIDSVKNWTLVD